VAWPSTHERAISENEAKVPTGGGGEIGIQRERNAKFNQISSGMQEIQNHQQSQSQL
jgi:hypothetical protein